MKKLLAAILAAHGPLAFAGAIDAVSTTLYGDPRPGNPDGIELSVEGVQRGANENIFDFTVDWTGPMTAIHPDAKLLEFYFNVNPTDAGQWSITDVTAGYNVVTPASVQGGGNPIGFLFELDQQPPNSSGIPLNFALTYAGGEITSENFELAPDWESNDPSLTEGQLGAHIGALAVNQITCPQGGCSDSGFAVGDWGTGGGGGGGGGDPTPIAEPGSLALLGMGLAGLVISRRRK